MTQGDTTRWPLGLVTLADWEAMGQDELHQVECSEGVLVVTPKPVPRHQRAMQAIANALDAHLPEDMVSVPDVDVLLSEVPLTVRAPDIVVTSLARLLENPPRFDAGDICLAVEIISEGSRRIDRVTKLSEYAEAGIPDYWIVDLADPVTLTVHRLRAADTYDLVAEHAGGRPRITTAGASYAIDLDVL